MTIYLDIVLLENIVMNYIILYVTGIVYKTNIRTINLIISAVIGGIYAVVSFVGLLEIYSNLILKMLLSIIMIYIAFKPKTLKILLKELAVFYLISFVFGGVAFALLYFVKPQEILMKNGLFIGTYPIKIVLLGAIVGFITIKLSVKAIKTKLSRKDMFCELIIKMENVTTKVRAMIDTGNLLKEPITGNNVVIVEKNSLIDIIPTTILENLEEIMQGKKEIAIDNYISKFRVIPFSSLGKQNGILLGIKPDYIAIKTEDGNTEMQDTIIGIYNNSLTKNGLYTALIGLEIIKKE